jgi:hypothetical protein
MTSMNAWVASFVTGAEVVVDGGAGLRTGT